jgi:hypothetical protein
VTSTDFNQVSHYLNRLHQLAELLNPFTAIELVIELIEEVSVPPPGDPVALRELAADFMRAADGAGTVGSQVATLARGQLSSAWQGAAGASAAQVLTSTADLIDAVRPAFATAAVALREYADVTADLLHRHQVMRDELHAAWQRVRDCDWYDVFGLEQSIENLVAAALRAVAEASAIWTASRAEACVVDGRLGDVTDRARATLLHRHGADIRSAVVLADVSVGTGGAGGDNAVLSTDQANRAYTILNGLSDQDRAAVEAALAKASSPAARAYLLKALAAGHTPAEVTAFAQGIAGKDDAWLRQHLSLVDTSSPGGAYYGGEPIRQVDGTTCGSASLLIARAYVDPVLAFDLTTGGDANGDDSGQAFAQRFAKMQTDLHDQTNTLWPERFGTTPWAMADYLNDHSGELGAGYGWSVTDDTDPASIGTALDQAVGAADRGQPVPLLVGDSIPRHYVLLLGHDGSDLIVYDPSGDVMRVSEDDFRNGSMQGVGGWAHVQAVILPKA